MPSLHTRIGRLSQWTRTFRLGRRAPASTQRNQPPARILTYDEQVELLDAYRGLRDAEKRTGATLGGARGADMSDAATVRALAKMLDDLGAAASVPKAEIRSGISPLDWLEEPEGSCLA